MMYKRSRDAWRIAARYAGEQRVTAWVNPHAPDVPSQVLPPGTRTDIG